jgi:hypothetical protein
MFLLIHNILVPLIQLFKVLTGARWMLSFMGHVGPIVHHFGTFVLSSVL